jgi:DNA repair exonuclease SbcCD ATPase subunit
MSEREYVTIGVVVTGESDSGKSYLAVRHDLGWKGYIAKSQIRDCPPSIPKGTAINLDIPAWLADKLKYPVEVPTRLVTPDRGRSIGFNYEMGRSSSQEAIIAGMGGDSFKPLKVPPVAKRLAEKTGCYCHDLTDGVCQRCALPADKDCTPKEPVTTRGMVEHREAQDEIERLIREVKALRQTKDRYHQANTMQARALQTFEQQLGRMKDDLRKARKEIGDQRWRELFGDEG